MGPVQTKLRTRLEQALQPAHLEIEDQSHQHAGHSGSRPSGETHFHVIIKADVFAGLNRVERQRKVFAALGDMMQGEIHALSIQALDS